MKSLNLLVVVGMATLFVGCGQPKLGSYFHHDDKSRHLDLIATDVCDYEDAVPYSKKALVSDETRECVDKYYKVFLDRNEHFNPYKKDSKYKIVREEKDYLIVKLKD